MNNMQDEYFYKTSLFKISAISTLSTLTALSVSISSSLYAQGVDSIPEQTSPEEVTSVDEDDEIPKPNPHTLPDLPQMA